jgi:hypothetical protein
MAMNKLTASLAAVALAAVFIIGLMAARTAAVIWQRYTLHPVDIAAFASVERNTGRPVALTNFTGRNWHAPKL